MRGGSGDAVERVERAVAETLAPHPRVVLAVSGGVDSMVLLHAAARVARERVARVATFDHGTGPHATEAAALVAERARSLGFPVHVGRAAGSAAASEAAWRGARWRFLREVARADAGVEGAPSVATAHTRDDQVETVLMRALRDAGARGLSGLYAPGDVVRPLLALTRAEVEAYADARGVPYVEDPSNRSPRFLRNRVRHELLPALRRAAPELDEELLALARRAAAWREEVEAVVDALEPRVAEDGALYVARPALLGYDPAVLCVLWPALAARVHATLDRRGTRRVAEFTTRGLSGAAIQLSGGWEVVRRRDWLVVRRTERARGALAAVPPTTAEIPLAPDGVTCCGGWLLRPLPHPAAASPRGAAWTATLPTDRPLAVRAWRPGDRMTARGERQPRRVKHFLRAAGLVGPERAGWPVVLAGDEIVWVPGVRRSDAASVRSGRPGRAYVCERNSR